MKEHLVILDMQTEFMNNKPPTKVDQTKSVIQKLVADARKTNCPITFSVLRSEVYGNLIPELNPQLPDALIHRDGNDAFSSNLFLERMRDFGLLFIAGCNLEFCVRATVESAVKKGLQVVVYKNATLSRDKHSLLKTQTELMFLQTKLITYIDYS